MYHGADEFLGISSEVETYEETLMVIDDKTIIINDYRLLWLAETWYEAEEIWYDKYAVFVDW
jgi:hypothetical protein